MKNLHFTSLCVLASLLLIANSQTTLFCSDTYPDRQDFCPLIYAPVCANYPRVCLTLPCPQVQEFANACEACADANVESYVDGPCSVDNTEGEFGEGEVGETGENGENGEGEFTEEGWLDGKTVCTTTPESLILCATIWNPVCGYVNGQDVGTTYANDCVACQGGADYYLPGACPGDEELMEAF